MKAFSRESRSAKCAGCRWNGRSACFSPTRYPINPKPLAKPSDLSFKHVEARTCTHLSSFVALRPVVQLLDREPETKNNAPPLTPSAKPQTPNPGPQIPDPKPQTLNPKSQTPNPKPQTLNPKPSTLNPQPQPLFPQPSTLKQPIIAHHQKLLQALSILEDLITTLQHVEG